MRIIAGNFKGRIIKAPKNLPVRPTTDFAKEALFQLLSNELDFTEITVLDLFTGTGNMSYECCSRGAQKVTAVDKARSCFLFVKHTKELLGFEQLYPVKSDAFVFIKRSKPKQYNLVFADPPYALDGVSDLPTQVFEQELLKENGLLVVEHSKEHDFSNSANFAFHRSYGHVNFSFFRN